MTTPTRLMLSYLFCSCSGAECPLCLQSFPLDKIEAHASRCGIFEFKRNNYQAELSGMKRER